MPRRYFMLLILSFSLSVWPSISRAQNTEKKALTNQDVTDLVRAGISSEIVVAKIKSSACNFDTSPAALKDLKSANVPDAVILAMVTAAPTNNPARADSPSSPHPTVDQILDKYIDAISRDAFQKRASTHWKGVMESAGKTVLVEGFEEPPNKSLIVGSLPTGQETRDGFDGSMGWTSSSLGVRDKTAQELTMEKSLNEFGWDPRQSSAGMVFKGQEKVGDRPTYVIEMDLKEAGLIRMFFDQEHALLLRRDVEVNAPQGRQTYSWYFEDFRNVNGRKVAFVRRQPQTNVTIKISEIEDNVAIDDAKFRRPEGGKTIPSNSVRAVAYRVIPQQNTTYIQSGTNSSYTSCYGSGQFSTFGNYGNLNMNTNCNTTYTTPTQIPMTWKWADVYITVEDANRVYLIGCRANWRWSNCEPLVVGDVFPAEISGGTMIVSALKNGKKAIHTKYNILQTSQK